MKYTIEVTKEDIEKSVRGDAEDCPVALAACRALGRQRGEICVDPRWIDDLSFCSMGAMAIPKDAEARISKFDEGGGMEPFSFEIEVDD